MQRSHGNIIGLILFVFYLILCCINSSKDTFEIRDARLRKLKLSESWSVQSQFYLGNGGRSVQIN